jgi:hypothetical protein
MIKCTESLKRSVGPQSEAYAKRAANKTGGTWAITHYKLDLFFHRVDSPNRQRTIPPLRTNADVLKHASMKLPVQKAA